MLEQTTEIQELSLEKVIETKLVQNNVTEQILAALKDKYGGLRLKAIDDKESYLELKTAAKDCAKVRNLAVKLCKEGRERAVKEQKLWVAKEKEVVGRVMEVEGLLDAEIQKFDDEVERKANEEKRRKEEEYIGRQAALTKLGAVYSNGNFNLGETSFEAELIKGSSPDVWEEAILPKFRAEYEKIEAVRIEEERLKQEAAAEMRRQQEELQRQQEELRRQREEMERQKLEAERADREKAEAEAAERRRVQAALQSKRLNLLLPFNQYGEQVDMANLWAIEEEDFDRLLTNKKAAFEEYKVKKEEADRIKKEKEIEAAKAEALRIAEEERKREESRKAEELAQAGDKEKYLDLIAKLKAITVPEMHSWQYRKKAAVIREKLDEILSI